MLKQRTIQTLLVLLTYLAVAGFLPLTAHRAAYTVSLLIKDLLILLMPLTVGCFVASSVASFQKKAPLFILALLVFEAGSNFCSVWYAYLCGHLAASTLPALAVAAPPHEFSALWRLPLSPPLWWSADKGALAGLAVGCAVALAGERLRRLAAWVGRGRQACEWVLTRVFSRLVPLFILGFVSQTYQTGMLHELGKHYSVLVVWLVGALALYLFGLLALGAGFQGGRLRRHMRCLLPAGGVALTCGCSLSTMPWTIAGVEKVLQDPSLGKAIIPATTNIQQIGDCITNAFLCCLIYRNLHGTVPDIATWFTFSLMFVAARYATTAIMGGAIFIMIPIYETYLGFTPAMIATVMAFNVLLDLLVTSANVVANGALCIVFEQVWNRLSGKERKQVVSCDSSP